MTSSNGNNSDRLDRIEKLFEQNEIRLGRMILQQESDNRRILAIERSIEAMLEQRATDRLEHEESMSANALQIRELKEIAARQEENIIRLTRIEEGQNAMLGSIDENQPTILRRLMAIENKVDTLIERNQ